MGRGKLRMFFGFQTNMGAMAMNKMCQHARKIRFLFEMIETLDSSAMACVEGIVGVGFRAQ